MINPTYYTLGKRSNDAVEAPGFKASMLIRDLLSSTHSLVEMPTALLKSEIDDIELAHSRLSKIIQRITNGQA